MKLKTIEQYIENAPKETRARLREMQMIIRKAAPGATENIKWGMPSFSYKRILVNFAIFKHHIGFYPTPRGIKAFEKEFKNFKTGKGSIQFPLEKPLPKALIRKMVLFRVKDSKEKDAKWKPKM